MPIFSPLSTVGLNQSLNDAGFSVPQQQAIANAIRSVEGGDYVGAYGTGTPYTFTNVAAAIAMGTMSPNLVLPREGSWLVFGNCQIDRNGATVVAETATVKIRRTNNTPADISNSIALIDLPVSTTLTDTLGTFTIDPFVYQTANSNDALSMFANVSATLGAGTIRTPDACILAIRLF